MPCTVHNRSTRRASRVNQQSPGRGKRFLRPGLWGDPRARRCCWNWVVLPSLAAGCDVVEDPSSDVAGTGAGAAGPGMLVTPERPSGTSTFWFT